MRTAIENFNKFARPWAVVLPLVVFAMALFSPENWFGDFARDFGIFVPIGVISTVPIFFLWEAFRQFNESKFGPATGSVLLLIVSAGIVMAFANVAEDARFSGRDDLAVWLGVAMGITFGIFIPRVPILSRKEPTEGSPLFQGTAFDEILRQSPDKILPDGTRVYSTPMLDGRIRITSISPNGRVTYAKAFPPDRPPKV